MQSLGLSRAQLLTALVCTVVLGIDLSEISLGSALSAIFSAAPYHLDPHRLSWIVSAVYVGAVVGAAPWGWAADRWGTGRVIGIVLSWLGVVSVATAAVDGLGALPFLRALAGLSLGALPPLVITHLTGILPANRRGATILWVSGVSFLAGPATLFGMRAVVKAHYLGIPGWRWPFLIVGGLAFLLSLCFFVLPEAVPAPGSQARTPVRAPDPTASPASLRQRVTLVAALYFLHPWGQAAFSLSLGPSLIRRGHDLTNTLLFLTLNQLGPSIATFLAGTVVDRFDRRYTLTAACAALNIACVGFFAFDTTPMLFASLVLFGMAAGFYLPLMSSYATEILPRPVRGKVTASAWALNRSAAFLAPLVVLPLLASRGGMAVALVVCAAWAASAAVLAGLGPPSANIAAVSMSLGPRWVSEEGA